MSKKKKNWFQFIKNQVNFCCVKKMVFGEKIQICVYLIKTKSFGFIYLNQIYF